MQQTKLTVSKVWTDTGKTHVGEAGEVEFFFLLEGLLLCERGLLQPFCH